MSKKRLTIDFIRAEFLKRNFVLLTKEYQNSKQKLRYKCYNGHFHSIRWDHFKAGHGCPYCNGRPVITIDYVKKSFSENGYKLLSNVYVNSSTKLDYICNNGHKRSMSWGNWKTGHRCPACCGKEKKTVDDIKVSFLRDGYKLLSNDYNNHHDKLKCKCDNGHDYTISWSNWQKGSRCPKCKSVGYSIQEYEISRFIKSLGLTVINNDRSIITPYELDIVVPDKEIAIEYCGLYWHSELLGKDKKYHLNKLNACKKKNYRLITIFEDEFINNKEIVFSRLNNILGISEDCSVVYARKCVIDTISTKQISNFCKENHIQGYAGSSIKLGAFYNNELVSVMSFSKPSISKGSALSEGVWELNRFCSKLNYNVVGIASKMLSYFENNYNWKSIFSYADRRWSEGNLYNKLGFNLCGETQPNYWYFKQNNKRIHRFALRKNNSDPRNVTEWGIRKNEGWNRVWDCGNFKFEKNNLLN